MRSIDRDVTGTVPRSATLSNAARAAAALLASLALSLLRAGEARGAWSWELPAERYRGLNAFERAQYDKAANLYKKKNPEAAASEFEKFKVQFPDSSILPYVIFMRAKSLHAAKQRHKAIKIYTEVLDYFGDDVQDAAPALYYMGIAHFDNGDVRDGLECMKEMVEDEDYQKHPLAAGALRRLADNHWKNKERELAVKYWKQVIRDFWKQNQHESQAALRNVTYYYVGRGEYEAYEAWLVTDENGDNAAHRKWVVHNAVDRAWEYFDWNAHRYSRFAQDKRHKDMGAFYAYYKSRREWYEKAGDLWSYFDKALSFTVYRYGDAKERGALVDEIVAAVKKWDDKGKANGKFAWLCDRLRDAGDYARARYCIGLIEGDPAYAAYKEYELLSRENKWPAALSKLQEIEKMANEYWTPRARNERARVYMDVLHQYANAIKLYREISQPPGTLWRIQECYKRWGKLKEALATLTEIENMFPDDAPRAAWHKASYYHEAGEAKKAIAQARKILMAYKKSPEASHAHQLLEKYGIATGGGVFDGD